MKLSGIRKLGRYKNPETEREVNVYKGANKQRSTDHLFYLYRGKRIYITQSEFYGNWTKAD